MEKKNTIMDNPANGQKRWRITSGKQNSLNKKCKKSKLPKPNRTIECLQNSLQIAAAGQQYQSRRLPSKRPRNKPGMPKDFVFVDLSPVKNVDESADESDKSVVVSPSITPNTTILGYQDSNATSYFELSSSNDSFQSLQSDDESIFSSLDNSSVLSKCSTFGAETYMQEYNQINTQSSENNDALLGLGILNIDMTSNAGHWMPGNGDMFYQESFNYGPENAYHAHINPFPAYQQPKVEPQSENLEISNTVPQLPTQTLQSTSHRRTKSASEPSKKRSNSTLQFRAYKAPSNKEKKIVSPELSHRRAISEASLSKPRTTNAFEFMDYNNQMPVTYGGGSPNTNSVVSESNSFTPNTDYSETEDFNSDLLKSSNVDAFLLGGCGSNEFLGHNQFDFDINSYVSY